MIMYFIDFRGRKFTFVCKFTPVIVVPKITHYNKRNFFTEHLTNTCVSL